VRKKDRKKKEKEGNALIRGPSLSLKEREKGRARERWPRHRKKEAHVENRGAEERGETPLFAAKGSIKVSEKKKKYTASDGVSVA